MMRESCRQKKQHFQRQEGAEQTLRLAGVLGTKAGEQGGVH